MKRIYFLLAVLSCSLAAFGQTTTYTGTIKDLAQATVTSGRITWALNAPTIGQIPGTGSFVTSTVSCLISSAGHPVASSDGTSPCVITNNTALTPTGTSYTLCIQPYYTTPGSCIVTYASGGSVDISTVVPTPATQPSYGVASTTGNNTWGGTQTFSAAITGISAAFSGSVTAANIPITIKYFGAVGDGSTDDSTALAAALTYAKANNVCLYFPNGAYMYSTPLIWDTDKTLCMAGERSTTAYLDYNGGATTNAFLVKNTTVSSNGYFSDVNFRNIGFASNTSAANALHVYLATGTMDSIDLAGGSTNSLLCDSCNLQGDVRNLRVAPGAFFPAITGATCVNGATFAGAGGIPSGQFSLNSPTIEGCSAIGLNMSDASSIAINNAQIAGNHQQLYQNCTSSCNPNGNTYNQALFEGGGAPGACGSTGCNIAITNVSIASNVATLTAVNNFTAGETVYIYGMTNATYMDSCGTSGCTPLTVLSAGLSGTQFEANFTHADASTVEAGVATSYLPNQVVNSGNVFIGTNFGFIPTLVSGNYNYFESQSILNPQIQTGATNTVLMNNTVASDSTDGGTGTMGFGNVLTGTAVGTLSVPFNNLTAAKLTVNSSAAAGQDVATFAGNSLVSGPWGIALTGAGVAQEIYLDMGTAGVWGDTIGSSVDVGAIGGTPTARSFTSWCTFAPTQLGCPSFAVGSSTVIPSTATGYHGSSGTKVQLSDGTGTSGNFPKFASDGSVTDGGLAVTAVPQSLASCGTTTTCSNTAQASPRIVFGTVALSGGTATVASMTAWTSTTSYVCSGTDQTSAAAVQIVNTSTSSITITGTGTDVIGYQCVGN